MAIVSINPTTGETLREFPELTNEAIDQKLAAAARAFQLYRGSTFAERGAMLQTAATLLEQEVDSIAPTMTLPVGKLIGSEKVAAIIADRRVQAVTLTGSDRAGSEVAAAAGRVIKKCVLELGGSDPFVVMPSADLEAALTTAVKARTINSGQSCIAAKRFLIAESIYDEFVRRFVEKMEQLKVGDPLDEATEIGPLATPSIRDGVDEQVRKSVAAGAKLLAGGKSVEGNGNFYAPTVLAEIPKDAP